MSSIQMMILFHKTIIFYKTEIYLILIPTIYFYVAILNPQLKLKDS